MLKGSKRNKYKRLHGVLQAIFQRLVEDSFCELAPSIIVTAKGMPDLSTRVFLRQLHEAFPQLPVLGLVDWNPSGGISDSCSICY